jgi:hypothetical protein
MTRPLWTALLAGHVAWSLHLMVSYFLATVGCVATPDALPAVRHGLTAAALVVTLGATLYGAREAARDQAAGEQRYAGLLTLALNVAFLFAIALAGAAGFLLPPCV